MTMLAAANNFSHLPPHFTSFNSRVIYCDAAEIRAKRCKSNQQEKSFVPPAVENVAGYNHKQILPLQVLEYEPIKGKNDG
jgi:hypothetical protein